LPTSISQPEGEGRILFRRRSRNAASAQKTVRVFSDIATICTSDYLGIRFEVSSFTKAELLAAILTCERDATERNHRDGASGRRPQLCRQRAILGRGLPIDRASVSVALRGMKKGYQSDVACGRWYFGPGGRHNANHAGSVAVTSGGKWATKQGCFEIADPDLMDVLKTEKEIGLH
jgi:hypothetical protein